MKISQWITSPRAMPFRKIFPQDNSPWTISPKQLPPGQLIHGKLPRSPDHYQAPPGQLLKSISSWIFVTNVLNKVT